MRFFFYGSTFIIYNLKYKYLNKNLHVSYTGGLVSSPNNSSIIIIKYICSRCVVV